MTDRADLRGRFLGFVKVRPDEAVAAGRAFLGFFFLLTGYYLMRPIRDAVGAGKPNELPWLYLGTFVSMTLAVPLFAFLASRFPRKTLVTIVYRFFAANVLILAAARRYAPDAWHANVDRVFFVWLSVFNLAVVALFWSHMADLFDRERSRRLFGLIAGGGSIGGGVGSIITAALVSRVGVDGLFVLAAVLLEATARVTRGIAAPPRAEGVTGADTGEPLGGSVFAGFTAVFRSPYLLAICAYLFLSTLNGTALYSQQSHIVNQTLTDAADRARFFAHVNLATQILTFVFQTLVVARFLGRFGVGWTLALLPVLYVVGFTVLGVATSLAISAVFEVIRKSTVLGMAEPTRHVLFASVDRETKYKAKNFIDTIVYRGGDVMAVWIFAELARLGVTPSTIAFLTVPVAVAWIGVGIHLGGRRAAAAASVA